MEKLSWTQFNALPRQRGRIMNLYDVFLQLTQEQVDVLHSDDWSYYYELQEELDYMMEEFR